MIDWYGSKTAARRKPLPPSADSLERFHAAQRKHYRAAYQEIRAGRKDTHWMWFVFPQLRALAKSDTARYFGIIDKAEAWGYLDDAVLRVRLAESTIATLGHRRLMYSRVDTEKLQASMTLFATVAKDPTLPRAVLEKFYGGKEHQLTLDVLAGKPIVLPRSKPHLPPRAHGETAMGRVEWKQDSMWDDTPPEHDDPEPDRAMDRAEVARYVRGFNLPGAVARQIVDKWMEDQDRARDAG